MLGIAPFSIPAPAPLDQLLSLSGRVAVVTGGSRGIGEAIVGRLAQAGAAVVVTARGKEALDQIEARIATTRSTAIGVQADAGGIEDARRVIDLAVSRFGRVDILVNNVAAFPGVCRSRRAKRFGTKRSARTAKARSSLPSSPRLG
jgi:NAD(P)-dependent dehydrogenase (short-subunit alcohol dehydrogenase family)